MEDFGAGIGLTLIAVIVVSLATFIASDRRGNEIAGSCELSGYVVINDKAYKCELIK